MQQRGLQRNFYFTKIRVSNQLTLGDYDNHHMR